MPKNSLIRYIYSVKFLRKILRRIMPNYIFKKIPSILFENQIKPKISYKSRQFLNNYFKEGVLELGVILNKDFTKWIR